MNRTLSMMILTLVLVLTLSACACSGGTSNTSPTSKPPAVTATPLPSPVQTPEVSPVIPEATPGETPGDMTGDMPQTSPDGESAATPEGTEGPSMMGVDVTKLILELEKLSEVETAVVAAHGGRAIVGLNFDAQYQGTLTERIEEMVVSAVSSVEEMLTDVAVTADPALIEQIRTLSADTAGKEMTPEQVTQFDELYTKIKPGKSAEDTAQ